MSTRLVSGVIIQSRIVNTIQETGVVGGTVIADGTTIQGDGSAGSPLGVIPGVYDPAGSAAAVVASLASHVGNTSNPHSVTASQVGLGNVDNTSDADKPISTATQLALDGKLGTGLAWLLQGTSTIPAAATITANAHSRLIFNGTYSGVGGYYFLINPSITATAVNQVILGTNIEMPINTGGFGGITYRMLRLATSGAGASSIVFTLQADGTSAFIDSGSQLYIRSGGASNILLGLAGQVTFNNGAAFTNGSAVAISPALNGTGGSVTNRALLISPTINATAGTTSSYGIHYNPTISGTTGLTIYGIVVTPPAALNGFGVTPTAVVDIAASSTVRASLRIQSGVAPTTPNDGDIWFDGTDLKLRSGGTTYTLTKT